MKTPKKVEMENIKLAFYKVQKGDIWGNVIAGWTGLFNWGAPKYCHCEIGFFIDGVWKWYSSASRNYDGTTGTRWIEAAVLFRNKERWDIYNVKHIRSIESMMSDCKKEEGKGYDWLGIAGFTTLFGQLNAKNKWYCSEICNYVFFGKWKKRISPIGFYVAIKGRIVIE